MLGVFIGGSRKIRRLDADVRRRIDSIVAKGQRILVGDANGADKAVQQYLNDRHYGDVAVFCAGGQCRNNVGHWPVRAVSTEGRRRGFEFFAAKDQCMADEADVGLMIWDGESVGTLMNVVRLLRKDKHVAVYISPARRFEELQSGDEIERFVSLHAQQLRDRIEKVSESELKANRIERQASLF